MQQLRNLSIYDTTLRDGEQAPGNAMTVPQKVEVAMQLERLGVDVVETGFPAASANDFEATRRLSAVITRAMLCAFARATRHDIKLAMNAVGSARHFQIEILTTASDIHLERKRLISRDEALRECEDAVGYARRIGFEEIVVAPEDATRADRAFLHRMVDVAIAAGATMIGIPDTVGACLPDEYGDLIAQVKSWAGDGVRVAVHTHNDLGLATANALAGILAGADECQVTLCGIGERAGNAPLEEVIAAVVSRPDVFGRFVNVDTTRIVESCRLLAATVQLPVPRSKAIIGRNAFATAAGIHQAGILKDPRTYEFLDPATFGATREIVLDRHSGRAALRSRLQTLGADLSEPAISLVYDALVSSESATIVSDDDLRALIDGVLREEKVLR
jgi:2-isopropylmalate synthase